MHGEKEKIKQGWTRRAPAGARVLAAVLLAFTARAWAESGTAARELTLYEESRAESKVVGKLAKDAKFELVKRERFWALVSSPGPSGMQQGWVQSFYLNWADTPAGSAPSASRGLAEIVGLGARRNGAVTATLGVRGLDEEQLKSARFNAEELNKLEGYGVQAPVAARFAAEVPLEALKLEYLAAPAASIGAGAAGGEGGR